ncbi:hypothetical protein KIN20_002421 [Parelaphostrongylus tenuis]|uniref:Uncharacterized protein n=1 Tax=Parelaphostrongylus tenuis TaxID=148309 RepID=A0AAD5QD03_PARTN|nr:hypothetical protein KIN20_002421 [Parelaphostrongylus tenuis]
MEENDMTLIPPCSTHHHNHQRQLREEETNGKCVGVRTAREDLPSIYQKNRYQVFATLATELDVAHTTVLTHLRQLNFVHKKPRQKSLLKGRRFESLDEVEEVCQEFFNSKSEELYFE